MVQCYCAKDKSTKYTKVKISEILNYKLIFKEWIKLLSMMLVLSIFDNFVISHVSASCDDSIQDCTKEYIVQINDDNNFNELKKEMSDDDKLVITHDYSDEKYLCKENEMVLDLTENEAEKLNKKMV